MRVGGETSCLAMGEDGASGGSCQPYFAHLVTWAAGQAMPTSASPSTSFAATHSASGARLGGCKRQHKLVRLGLARGRSGRAQHLRGRGNKGRVVGPGSFKRMAFVTAVGCSFSDSRYVERRVHPRSRQQTRLDCLNRFDMPSHRCSGSSEPSPPDFY